MRLSRIWLGVVAVALGGSAFAQSDALVKVKPAKRPPFLSPAEMVKLIEASPVRYTIAPLEELDVARGRLADELWPRAAPPVKLPKVNRAAGDVGRQPPRRADGAGAAGLRPRGARRHRHLRRPGSPGVVRLVPVQGPVAGRKRPPPRDGGQ